MTHITDLNLSKKLIFACYSLAAAFVVLSPITVNAATFEPNTEGELVAYMFGILDTLQAQVDAKNGTASGSGSSRVSNYSANVAVETKITLRSEFTATNNNAVYAWFEYGEGSKLTSKTTRTEATGSGTTRTHARSITGLKSGTTYSYRPVFEISGGTKYYGVVRTFSTAKVGSGTNTGNNNDDEDEDDDNGNSTNVSSSKGSIGTDNSRYESYETIEVDWSVPSSRRDSTNWIGLFKTNASNNEYLSWRYLTDNTRGSLTFTAPSEGSYEFRLFYKNAYDDQVTSRKITVTD